MNTEHPTDEGKEKLEIWKFLVGYWIFR